MSSVEEKRAKIEGLAARVREQNLIRDRITGLLRENPKTVPELSEAIGMPTDAVFWHIVAMRKYGKVAETGLKGEYPLYGLVEEK
jgi:predicted transcriptional regulator